MNSPSTKSKGRNAGSSSKAPQKPFASLQLFRSLGFLVILYLVYQVTPLGVSYLLAALSGLFGIYLAGKCFNEKNSLPKSFFKHCLIFAILYILYCALEHLFSGNIQKSSPNDFIIYQTFQDIFSLFAVYAFCYFSTRLYWLSRHALTFETITLSSIFVWLLSGHRNYQLDSPKALSDFAWQQPWFASLGFGPQHALIILGVIGIIAASLYLYLSSLRPLIGEKNSRTHKRPLDFAQQLGVFILSLLFLGSFSWFVNQSYTKEMARSSNGVGLESEEGDSPLGFHSAVGKTKQPAALVRLGTDYPENPIAPLLYFREGALSKFNGREMVQATKEYDQDIPFVPPGKAFISEKKETKGRKELKQSVYLLIEQKNSFSLDYPKTIRIIKNPDPDRFKVSYQANSLAPTEPLENFISASGGSSKWSEKNFAHYLEAPASKTFKKENIYNSKEVPDLNSTPGLDSNGEDLRYAALARKLTQETDAPLVKAAKIVEHLSKASLYTRQPGHSVSKDEDPVAAYLFSKEMRGYCVHFAHASVYMMRLAGVPARIGTGYMVDSKYAKDGHLLLHLGDRHAWSEVYLEGVGWVIIDVTPENAENEEPIVPDPSLLEELMGKIDPSEELLDPLEFEDVKGKNKKNTLLQSIKPSHLKTFFALLLLAYLGLKTLLYFAYKFSGDPQKITERAWLAFSAKLSDLGINRLYGETNLEFSHRLKEEEDIDVSRLRALKEVSTYSEEKEELSKEAALKALEEANQSLNSNKSLIKRILAFFSPASLTKISRILLATLILISAISAQPSQLFAEESEEESASIDEILIEAQTFFMESKPIDARAKLQKALRLYPSDYRPHMMLGAYYLSEVGHFRLANRYLLKSEKLFLEKYPLSTRASGEDPLGWQNHSRLLYLLAESRLNLDNYQGALKTLEEYEKTYWESWLPGTKAWVLWKLGKTEKAINVAKAGLLQGASPGKTYNILGILYSSVKNRTLALEAYKNAIKTEKLLGSLGMVATPLNNAGEVYREMFEDNKAEAAWLTSLSFPDGCDHILPSLNLAVTYQESLRLFKAERVLSDFEACFAANSEKEDGEHKGLLALARARIAFREGKINLASQILEKTAASTQWFGRIGTNENDFKVAANASLVTTLRAKANYIKILPNRTLREGLKKRAEIIYLNSRAFFLARKVREMGLEELNDFEDLWIRYTDSMIDYPSLGDSLAGFPLKSFQTRVKRLNKIDNRKHSHSWYKLYLGENYLEKGKYKKAISLFDEVIKELRPKDRLIKSVALAKKIIAKKSAGKFLGISFSKKSNKEIEALATELFALLPSQLPYHSISLPVNIKVASSSSEIKKKLLKINKMLLKGAFKEASSSGAYELIISSGDKSGGTINLQLIEKSSSAPIISITKKTSSKKERIELVNEFILKVFSHREDPNKEPLPSLEILNE